MEALAIAHNMVFCGTDWWGLTQSDESFAGTVVANLNRFGVIVDRLQQAVVNALYLGRLMISPHGFATNRSFQTPDAPCSTPPSSTTTATRRAASSAEL